MIVHTILRIGIIRALNESAGRLLGPPHSTDKTTLVIKVRKVKKIRIRYKQVTHLIKDTTLESDKVRKEAKIRKQYNQVPHLTHDTSWESNENTINITNKSQEVSPFPAGDHKAAMNRRKSMRNTRHKKHK